MEILGNVVLSAFQMMTVVKEKEHWNIIALEDMVPIRVVNAWK